MMQHFHKFIQPNYSASHNFEMEQQSYSGMAPATYPQTESHIGPARSELFMNPNTYHNNSSQIPYETVMMTHVIPPASLQAPTNLGTEPVQPSTSQGPMNLAVRDLIQYDEIPQPISYAQADIHTENAGKVIYPEVASGKRNYVAKPPDNFGNDNVTMMPFNMKMTPQHRYEKNEWEQYYPSSGHNFPCAGKYPATKINKPKESVDYIKASTYEYNLGIEDNVGQMGQSIQRKLEMLNQRYENISPPGGNEVSTAPDADYGQLQYRWKTEELPPILCPQAYPSALSAQLQSQSHNQSLQVDQQRDEEMAQNTYTQVPPFVYPYMYNPTPRQPSGHYYPHNWPRPTTNFAPHAQFAQKSQNNSYNARRPSRTKQRVLSQQKAMRQYSQQGQQHTTLNTTRQQRMSNLSQKQQLILKQLLEQRRICNFLETQFYKS